MDVAGTTPMPAKMDDDVDQPKTTGNLDGRTVRSGRSCGEACNDCCSSDACLAILCCFSCCCGLCESLADGLD